jgi:cyclase
MSDGPEHAHEITSPGRPKTVEVADGVYAYVQPDGTWWINNTGFVVGPQGVFSIDACSTERRTRAYLAAIRDVSRAPVRTLVNTHHHGDHTFGNALFPAATIVAHERARAEAIAFGPARDLPFWDNPDWGQLPLEPPFLTFTDEVALHAGDTRITVKHVGTAAHTTNDVLAWFPEQSVLFCGDLVFNGGTPFLLMGSVAGCVEALEKVVLALGARTVVPGHGPVFEGTAPIEATLDYLRFVLDLAARGRAAGVPPLDAARETDLGRFAGWPDAERIVGNLHRAYAELAGTPRGGPVDVLAALADMVAYNGGKPLTCLALPASAGLHAVAGHEGAFFLRGWRGLPGPQRLEFDEIGIRRRGVQDKQPRGLVAVISERVRCSAWHQQEVVRPPLLRYPVEDERDRAVEHPEGLRAVHVPVRQRAAAARRDGPLHQGEVPVRLRGDGLEGHHAPPRRDDLALARGNDA